jgi:hypothetical protein
MRILGVADGLNTTKAIGRLESIDGELLFLEEQYSCLRIDQGESKHTRKSRAITTST